MSQQKKLEKVLDLLLSEDSEQASELLHQIIVEKARNIYESIVDEEDDNADVEEDSDEVGGEPNKDFTDEISTDKDEVDADEQNDGEAGDDEDDEFGDEGGEDGEFGDEGEEEGSTEERIGELEDELASLRADFDRIMDQEMQEPEHADLAGDFDDEDEFSDENEFDDEGEVEPAGNVPDFGGQGEQVVGEVVAKFNEKKKAAKLDKAPEFKKGEFKKKGAKTVEEETKFLNQVADTGQRGTAKLVGTGKGMTLGAEQNKSSFTNIPSRKDYGGKPTKVGGDGGTGGEYGKYNGDPAANKTPTDNVNLKPKSSSIKADSTAKYTGGKVAGDGFSKSPLSKRP